ncbi:MAG TPA: hypothetical protein VM864_02435 [Pyrinomonadaceae bacterium]|jgi:hypothetical protein|nr:hypothetical protein [Pyrinomonadaceae bacterium]
MAGIRVAFKAARLMSVAALASAGGHYSRPALPPHDYFDSYGRISWEDEKARLDNFAVELRHDPNLVGYIVVYSGRRSCFGEAKRRALRAKEYLVRTRDIPESRIRWMDGGYQEELRVILQPSQPDAPEFAASPTLKPGDAVVKNCQPKSTRRKSARRRKHGS